MSGNRRILTVGDTDHTTTTSASQSSIDVSVLLEHYMIIVFMENNALRNKRAVKLSQALWLGSGLHRERAPV